MHRYLSECDGDLSSRIWAPVGDGNRVEVSVDGVCRARNERYYYRTFEKDSGYLVVNLPTLSGSRTYYLHRVVWEAFRGPLRHGEHVYHVNGDKRDNRLENLAVRSRSEGVRQSWANRKEAWTQMALELDSWA